MVVDKGIARADDAAARLDAASWLSAADRATADRAAAPAAAGVRKQGIKHPADLVQSAMHYREAAAVAATASIAANAATAAVVIPSIGGIAAGAVAITIAARGAVAGGADRSQCGADGQCSQCRPKHVVPLGSQKRVDVSGRASDLTVRHRPCAPQNRQVPKNSSNRYARNEQNFPQRRQGFAGHPRCR